MGVDHAPAVLGDFPRLPSLLLQVCIIFCDLTERTVEERDFVLEPKSNIGILIEGSFLRGLYVAGFQGNGFVAVRRGQPDAAISVAMLNISTPENHQSGL
jgi:hypothetical protein